MTIQEQITVWTEEHLAESALFLVEVALSPGGRNVVVSIDGDAGVPIDACANLSRTLGEQLESANALPNAYTLVVQSAGVGTPLRHPRQFVANVGRSLTVQTLSGEALTGTLDEATPDGITLSYTHKEKGKKAETLSRTLALADLKKVVVEVSFK